MNCVLIVEDDSDINNFINDYFVIKGYSTIQAFSGTEGLLRLKNERDPEKFPDKIHFRFNVTRSIR